MLRLADVHPSVEKGSVRIWPFAATPSLQRLVLSAQLESPPLELETDPEKCGEEGGVLHETDITLRDTCSLLGLGRARQTDGGARGASSDPARRSDGERGKSDSYGGLLSPSPSVNPSLPFWVTGRASCRRRLCSAFHAPPDIERPPLSLSPLSAIL